jgi:hypothetical protein
MYSVSGAPAWAFGAAETDVRDGFHPGGGPPAEVVGGRTIGGATRFDTCKHITCGHIIMGMRTQRTHTFMAKLVYRISG